MPRGPPNLPDLVSPGKIMMGVSVCVRVFLCSHRKYPARSILPAITWGSALETVLPFDALGV